MITAPIKGGLEATKSAVEEVSRSGARARGQLQPFLPWLSISRDRSEAKPNCNARRTFAERPKRMDKVRPL